jgi:very-short-patch-repair endonuclease
LSVEINNIGKLLRKRMTNAESVLWNRLRSRQIEGIKFRRQEPIGCYIVDFVCHEKRIVIEVDGGQHATEKEKDNERDNWLNGEGYVVLRFWNNEVLKNIEGVLEVIRENCLRTPSPDPSHQGRGNKGGVLIKGKGKK